jgi:hypothetical protein
MPVRSFASMGKATIRVHVLGSKGRAPSREVPVALVAIDGGKARLLVSAETTDGVAEMEWSSEATHAGILGFVDPPIILPLPSDPEGTHAVTLTLPDCGSLRITVPHDLPPGARVRIQARADPSVREGSPMLQVSELDVPWAGADVELWPVGGRFTVVVVVTLEGGYVDFRRVQAEAVARGDVSEVRLLSGVHFARFSLVDPDGTPLPSDATVVSSLLSPDGRQIFGSQLRPNEEGVAYHAASASMGERVARGYIRLMEPTLRLWSLREIPEGFGSRNMDLGLVQMEPLYSWSGTLSGEQGPVAGAILRVTGSAGDVDVERGSVFTGLDGAFSFLLPQGRSTFVVHDARFLPAEIEQDVSSDRKDVVILLCKGKRVRLRFLCPDWMDPQHLGLHLSDPAMPRRRHASVGMDGIADAAAMLSDEVDLEVTWRSMPVWSRKGHATTEDIQEPEVVDLSGAGAAFVRIQASDGRVLEPGEEVQVFPATTVEFKTKVNDDRVIAVFIPPAYAGETWVLRSSSGDFAPMTAVGGPQSVVMQRSASVRLRFRPTDRIPSGDLLSVSVTMNPLGIAGQRGQSGELPADGSVSFGSLIPGRYKLHLTLNDRTSLLLRRSTVTHLIQGTGQLTIAEGENDITVDIALQ